MIELWSLTSETRQTGTPYSGAKSVGTEEIASSL